MVIDHNGPGDHGRFNVSVGMKHNSSLISTAKSKTTPMEEVCLSIPFPKQVKTANLDVNIGNVVYDEATKVAKWTIGKLSSNTGKMPQLSGKIVLQGAKLEEPPPFELNWKVPTASVSGIAIASLQLANEKYRPYKGVRTITRSGRFHIRSH